MPGHGPSPDHKQTPPILILVLVIELADRLIFADGCQLLRLAPPYNLAETPTDCFPDCRYRS